MFRHQRQRGAYIQPARGEGAMDQVQDRLGWTIAERGPPMDDSGHRAREVDNDAYSTGA